MIILLDTNVILDYLLKRERFEQAKAVIDLTESDDQIECVTASAGTDIYYICQKQVGSFAAQQMLDDLMKTLVFLEVKEENLKDAIALHWKDYEDALQYCVALSNGLDYIVTNNTNDFEADEVPAVTPVEFMEIYNQALRNPS